MCFVERCTNRILDWKVLYMELALGTVQFGMAYGLSGGKRLLPDRDVRMLLELAFERGVTILDTAPVYGDIESRIGSLSEGLEFRIVSKIPPLPNDLDDSEAAQWALECAQSSRRRLGPKLYALLFHRAEDLLYVRGDKVWTALAKWASRENIRVGVSGYDLELVRSLFETHQMSIAQLPGNALDQRISTAFSDIQPRPELHLRSAFLQGLLLLPIEAAIRIVPAANAALQRWHRWVKAQGITPLRGALSVVKTFKDVSACVVGVDNIGQLTELLNDWQEARPIGASALACGDLRSIDPRLWDNS